MKHKSVGTIEMKTADFQVKEAGPGDGLAEGEFIAYASVFGNVDSYGEIVDEDAFDRTLKEWAETDAVIPVLWGHDTFDPFNNIGGLKSAEAIKSGEKADGEKPGLKVHGILDLENPTAAQVYRLMKGRRTTKMSFAYAVREDQKADDGLHLKDLDLFEVSVVQIPANQEAEILTVKHAANALVKAGRVLSSKNEATLREARDAIDSVLASLATDGGDGEDGKAGNQPAGQQEEASGDQTEAKAGSQTEDPQGQGSAQPAEEQKSGPSVDTYGSQFALLHAAFAAEGD